MLGWRSKGLECVGSALFRGTLPPRLEDFAQLAAAGVRVAPKPAPADAHWAAALDHPKWGPAEVVCLRRFVPVPRPVVQFDPRLGDADREAATLARTAVSVRTRPTRKNVLGDRKLMLRYLDCLLGDDGLVAVDHSAERFWTRAALADELAHDADLDVESLFTTHTVYESTAEGGGGGGGGDDEQRRVYWMHTHGLAELGATDFDILRPAPAIYGAGYDTVRAIAFLILEGRAGPGTDGLEVFAPGGTVSFVPVEEFNRSAPPADVALRDAAEDPAHTLNRVVLCDPRGGGWVARLLGRAGRVRASRALSTVDGDRYVARFTDAAGQLMAERARKTFAQFRQLAAEFAEFEVKPLAKLGYETDHGGGADREHLWFEVHGFGGDAASVDATLLNQPFDIAALREGDRRSHELSRLTDWTIITPAGQITPRETAAARRLRAHAGEVREAMRAARGGQ